MATISQALAFYLTLVLLVGCGGVRVGQTQEEAASQPRPAPSEPPEDERDPKPETTPVVTTDLEAGGGDLEAGGELEAGGAAPAGQQGDAKTPPAGR